ncbi:unnamed protein product [Phytomonas sp. Hart1]|nr:unnamed protein product [Phytomonas sp. Hart1]|eukprot:CCW66863.1 unnamed protein product [Phytomonas sp. isolate Hart1]
MADQDEDLVGVALGEEGPHAPHHRRQARGLADGLVRDVVDLHRPRGDRAAGVHQRREGRPLDRVEEGDLDYLVRAHVEPGRLDVEENQAVALSLVGAVGREVLGHPEGKPRPPRGDNPRLRGVALEVDFPV